MTTASERKIIDLGGSAFHAGKESSQNPYQPRSYESELWHEGWRLARDVEIFKAMRQA